MAIMTNRSVGAGFSAARILADFVGMISAWNFVGMISAWNDARVTRKALSRLSDHELDDLGLVRGDIDDIAANAHTWY